MLKFIFTSSFEGGQWRWVCLLLPTLNNFSSFQFPVVKQKKLRIHRWPSSTPLSQGYKYFPSVYYYFCFTYSILFHPLSWFFFCLHRNWYLRDLRDFAALAFLLLEVKVSLKYQKYLFLIHLSPKVAADSRHIPQGQITKVLWWIYLWHFLLAGLSLPNR